LLHIDILDLWVVILVDVDILIRDFWLINLDGVDYPLSVRRVDVVFTATPIYRLTREQLSSFVLAIILLLVLTVVVASATIFLASDEFPFIIGTIRINKLADTIDEIAFPLSLVL